MGLLIGGVWHSDVPKPTGKDGSFQREASSFRHHIGTPDTPAETHRYHLFVSLACPWAHRTLIMRSLKGLQDIIPTTIVHPHLLEQGWSFAEPEPLYGFKHLHQLYTLAQADYTGRVSVPVLWDTQKKRIINNESADIMRIFNHAFDALTGNTQDFYPEPLRPAIDDINAFIYQHINNGVYKCGFAQSQTAYQQAYEALFSALDTVEARLDQHRYLVGNTCTEADIRLFTTLIRFDAVYVGHFKCNRNRIIDMPNLWAYLCDLYQQEGFSEYVNLEHIKQHYYYSHADINPTRIVPQGPKLDFNQAHHRHEQFA